MTDQIKPSRGIARLIEIMARLRTPGSGCPWDLEQSFETIVPYTLEEAYEVADAIERADFEDLRDELGDLLLQVVYHARMAEEADKFAFGDVVEAVTTKMIRRHPHVFGDAHARNAGAVNGIWDKIKSEEKAKRGARAAASVLDDVPMALPALSRAVKLQSKAAKVGFDWASLAPVFDKLKEELAEFEAEALPADPRGANDRTQRAAIEEEYGDILFVMANIARHLDIDPEAALRRANTKFTRRFAHIEARLAETGLTPKQSNLQQMDALWDEAKAIDKAHSAKKA